jgi:predicted TIM-barrel fold metal-dependent hydrolase
VAFAIDMHVHLPTVSFLDSAIKPFREPAEKFFHRKVPITGMEEVAKHYEKLDVVGVLLAWDAETTTGLPPLTNDEIAGIVAEFPERFIGFGSVDPWKGKRAVAEIERAIGELGLKGAKFHPGIQAFYPNDPRFSELFDKVAALGVPALFHTGTNGLGAGIRGGMGVRLDYTRPIYLDHLAADQPELTIVGAHPAWPWHEEMLAVIGHKANVFMDLSGWLPKYIPETVMNEARKRLSDRILFGSDYPFILPERWLEDFDALEGFTPEVKRKLLHDNAAGLLGLA